VQILYGNLAPEGCVAKITGKEGLLFEGAAKVYDSEEDMLAALHEDPSALKVNKWTCAFLGSMSLSLSLSLSRVSQCLSDNGQGCPGFAAYLCHCCMRLVWALRTACWPSNL
jgi:hypothetical protein